jgi:hypothetical protein
MYLGLSVSGGYRVLISDGRSFDLSWWPAHLAATKQVNVNMKYRLACAFACIDDSPVACFRDTVLSGQDGRNMQQVPDRSFVFRPHRIQRSNMIARDDQGMDRRLRIDIPESYSILICVNLTGWYLVRDYSAK